jgi:tetratricopeptide (TPR) repeat protein
MNKENVMKKIMKTLNITISTFLIIILTPACIDLDLEDPNAMTEESFWKTESDLYQGVIAAYDAMQLDGLFAGNVQVVLTGLSDEGTGEGTNEYYSPFRFKVIDSNLYLNKVLWDHFYTMISRAYQVIDRAPDVDGPNVAAIQGEAQYLVALAYFYLVNIFGENIAWVDRIQQPDDRPARAESGEIYGLIEELLMEAIPNLPLASEYAEADYGRVTKGAAQSLLGKVYMQQQKFMEAEPYFEDVYTSNEYALLANFADNFYERNVVNREAVFVVNLLHDGPASETNRNTMHRAFSPDGELGTYGDVQSTPYIYERFLIENDRDGFPDPRLDETIFHPNTTKLFVGQPYSWWENEFVNPEINTSFYKYTEQNVVEDEADEFDGGTDFIVIRYADVLLSYAESLNENGKTEEAYQYVDMVRERSNMEKLSVVHPGLDTEAFREQMMHERIMELSGEVVRFFDQKRWGLYQASDSIRDQNYATFKDGRSEFQPIPQAELDLNDNLIQNPGY